MPSNTYNELKRRNLQTFGTEARMEARLARFIKFEEKKALAARKAAWRRNRMNRRIQRNYRKWCDEIDYGHVIHEECDEEEPVEEEEQNVELEISVYDKEESNWCIFVLIMFALILSGVFQSVACLIIDLVMLM